MRFWPQKQQTELESNLDALHMQLGCGYGLQMFGSVASSLGVLGKMRGWLAPHCPSIQAAASTQCITISDGEKQG